MGRGRKPSQHRHFGVESTRRSEIQPIEGKRIEFQSIGLPMTKPDVLVTCMF